MIHAFINSFMHSSGMYDIYPDFVWKVCMCGTLKYENVSICDKVAKRDKISTLNMKIDAICEKLTPYVNKLCSLNA